MAKPADATRPGTRTTIAIRPENVRLVAPPAWLPSRLVERSFLGGTVLLKLATAGGEALIARLPAEAAAQLANDAALGISWDRAHAVPLAD